MTHACSELHRRAVVDAGGLVLGEVDELLIDPTSWRVLAFRIKVRRELAEELGVANPFFRRPTMDVSSDVVQSIGDAVLLRVNAQALHDVGAQAGESHAHA